MENCQQGLSTQVCFYLTASHHFHRYRLFPGPAIFFQKHSVYLKEAHLIPAIVTTGSPQLSICILFDSVSLGSGT